MFSLCIPTMNRYDTFLKKNIEKYLICSLIDEIIITDENGNDYEKLKRDYCENNKIKVFKNDYQMGPFLNKLKCCKLAKNEWIVLMDSDNYADHTYFENALKYIQNNNLSISKETILAPSFAKPNFNYKSLSPNILNKNNLRTINKSDLLQTCMNTGNYVINKYLIDNINIEKETENIKKSSACDVIFFNTLLLEQFNLMFHILQELEYEHVVHDGSVYINTHNIYRDFNNQVHNRFKKYL